MEHTIRSISVSVAVLVFFAMAIAGWVTGACPATCSYRAATGAIITYVVVNIACRLIVKIVVEEMIQNRVDRMRRKKEES